MYNPVAQRWRTKDTASATPCHENCNFSNRMGYLISALDDGPQNYVQKSARRRSRAAVPKQKITNLATPRSPWNGSTNTKMLGLVKPVRSRKPQPIGTRARVSVKKVLADLVRKTGAGGLGVVGNGKQAYGGTDFCNNQRSSCCARRACCRCPGLNRANKKKTVAFHATPSGSGQGGTNPSRPNKVRLGQGGVPIPRASNTRPLSTRPKQRIERPNSGDKVTCPRCQTCSHCNPHAHELRYQRAGHRQRACTRSKSVEPWDCDRQIPVRSKSESFKCMEQDDLGDPYTTMWSPLRGGEMSPGFAQGNSRCCRKQGRHCYNFDPMSSFQESNVKNYAFSKSPNILGELEGSRFNYDHPKSILKQGCSRQFPLSHDPVDFCTRALSDLRLKERELMDKYGTFIMDTRSESGDRCYKSGLSDLISPRVDTWSPLAECYEFSCPVKPYSCRRERNWSHRPTIQAVSDNRHVYKSTTPTNVANSRPGALPRYIPSRSATVCSVSGSPSTRSRVPSLSSLGARGYRALMPRAELRLMGKYLSSGDDGLFSLQGEKTTATPRSRPPSSTALQQEGNTSQSHTTETGPGTSARAQQWLSMDGGSGLHSPRNDLSLEKSLSTSALMVDRHGLRGGRRYSMADCVAPMTGGRHDMPMGLDGVGVTGKSVSGEVKPDVRCSSHRNNESACGGTLSSSCRGNTAIGTTQGQGTNHSLENSRRPASASMRASDWRSSKPLPVDSYLEGEKERLWRIGSIIS